MDIINLSANTEAIISYFFVYYDFMICYNRKG